MEPSATDKVTATSAEALRPFQNMAPFNLSTETILRLSSVWAETDVAMTALQRAHDLFAQIDSEDLPARALTQKMRAARSLARRIRELADTRPRDPCDEHSTTPDASASQPTIYARSARYKASSDEDFIESIFERLWGAKGYGRLSFAHLMDVLDRSADDREIHGAINDLLQRRMVYGFDVDDLAFHDVVHCEKSQVNDTDSANDATLLELFKFAIAAAGKAVQIYSDKVYQQQRGALKSAGIDETDLRISYAQYYEDVDSTDTFEMFVLGMGTLDPSAMAKFKESARRLRSARESQDDVKAAGYDTGVVACTQSEAQTGTGEEIPTSYNTSWRTKSKAEETGEQEAKLSASEYGVGSKDGLTEEEMTAVHGLYKRQTGRDKQFNEFSAMVRNIIAKDPAGLAEWKRKAAHEMYGALTKEEMKLMLRSMHSRYEELAGKKFSPQEFQEMAQPFLSSSPDGEDAMLEFTGKVRKEKNISNKEGSSTSCFNIEGSKLDAFLRSKTSAAIPASEGSKTNLSLQGRTTNEASQHGNQIWSKMMVKEEFTRPLTADDMSSNGNISEADLAVLYARLKEEKCDYVPFDIFVEMMRKPGAVNVPDLAMMKIKAARMRATTKNSTLKMLTNDEWTWLLNGTHSEFEEFTKRIAPRQQFEEMMIAYLSGPEGVDSIKEIKERLKKVKKIAKKKGFRLEEESVDLGGSKIVSFLQSVATPPAPKGGKQTQE